MIREYTKEKLDEMCRYMPVDDELSIDGVGMWSLSTNTFFNELFGDDVLRYSDEYYKKVLEQNIKMQDKLRLLFSAVWLIDRNNGKTLEGISANLETYKAYIGRMSEVMCGEPGSINREAIDAAFMDLKTEHDKARVELALALIERANGDINALSEDEKEFVRTYLQILDSDRYGGQANVLEMNIDERNALIGLYELLYSENADKLDTFFEEMAAENNKDLLDDINNIKYIAYTSDEPYRSYFFEYIDDVYLDKFILEDDSSDDINKYYQYYSPRDGSITIYFHEGQVGRYDEPPYVGFFHEMGHVIDDRLCDGTNGGDRFSSDCSINGATLQDVARQDVRNHIYNSIVTYINQNNIYMTDGEIQAIIDEFMCQQGDKNNLWSNDMQAVYDEIREQYGYHEYNEDGTDYEKIPGTVYNMDGSNNEAVSDVFGGYTNNQLGGTGACHDENEYWYDSEGQESKRQSKELFAEYYSYNMVGADEAIASTGEYFEESMQFIDDALNTIYDNQMK